MSKNKLDLGQGGGNQVKLDFSDKFQVTPLGEIQEEEVAAFDSPR